MREKVSIVIPTYNSMEYIDETIQSCATQTHQDIEVVIIDDCSTDGTREYLKTLDNVVYIENKKNEGISRNVNKGVKISTGEYIIILGHDDVLPNFHIEKMLASFDDDTGLVHCNSIKINPVGDIVSLSRRTVVQVRKSKHALQELIKSNFIQSCGLMFRKETFLSFGGWDESYRLYGEWLSYVKFATRLKVVYNSKTFGFYRVHGGSTMRMINKTQKPELKKYKATCRSLALSGFLQSNDCNLNFLQKFMLRMRCLL